MKRYKIVAKKNEEIIKPKENNNIFHKVDFNTIDLNIEEWHKYISYYRHYIDKFATDVLGLTLFPFQRLLLRSMAKYQSSMLICCRGLTKSWISAVFMICMSILYPGISIGIVSGTGSQARLVIRDKIMKELYNYPNIQREIETNSTVASNCFVSFKNKSKILAGNLGIDGKGDNLRGLRLNLLLVDEARLVSDTVVETVLVPMTKTARTRIVEHNAKHPESPRFEPGKVIFVSSAFLKSCDLYKRFLNHYSEMKAGNSKYFVCSLDYTVGVKSGILQEADILAERDSLTMTMDKFKYEYEGQFVGSSNDSYFPYDLTIKSRVLETVEFEQPKDSQSIYVITHDIAVSDKAHSDNACTHVIKLKPRANGTFIKSIVFSHTMNGASLQVQRDFIRELYHIKYPNTEKIVIDALTVGEGLLSLLNESWEYNDRGVIREYPPLILDDDSAKYISFKSIPCIRPIRATPDFYSRYYPYVKGCFEDGSLRLTTPSEISESLYKMEEITAKEHHIHIEHDMLIEEAANIKQTGATGGRILYERIIGPNKRDRIISLIYGLSYIFEMEQKGKASLFQNDEIDEYDLLMSYIRI